MSPLPDRLPPIYDEAAHDQARRERRAAVIRRDRWIRFKRFLFRLGLLALLGAGVSVLGLPAWLDPAPRAEYDAWLLTVVERNDAIDDEARTLLPNRHIVMDPSYPQRVGVIGQKKSGLLAEVRETRPVWWRRSIHKQLVVTLDNSVRHLTALDQQYRWTNAQFGAMLDSGRRVFPEDAYAVFYTLSQQWPGIEELRIGKAYQREYDELRDRLDLDPVGTWPP